MRAIGLLIVLATGCADSALRSVAQSEDPSPPVSAEDPHGAPPDWGDCDQAFLGDYENRVGDTSVPAFSRWDATLDFGADWWPVDDGLAGDPADFAVTWRAWLRAWTDTSWEIGFGAASSGSLLIDDAVVASTEGGGFEPALVTVPVDAGQHRIEVRFVHAGDGTSALSLRTVGGDLSICPGAR